MRSTHTYVELEVSPAAYEEIAGNLRAAGYGHVFGADGEIDMHGLALTKEAVAVAAPGLNGLTGSRTCL